MLPFWTMAFRMKSNSYLDPAAVEPLVSGVIGISMEKSVHGTGSAVCHWKSDFDNSTAFQNHQ
eukprot:scaffold328_cov130-Cylindrotheca_fusiformis.AAC.19